MIVFAGDSITDADKNTTMDRIGNGYVRLMREALAAFSADWLSHVQCDRERRQFTQYSDALGKGHGCKRKIDFSAKLQKTFWKNMEGKFRRNFAS